MRASKNQYAMTMSVHTAHTMVGIHSAQPYHPPSLDMGTADTRAMTTVTLFQARSRAMTVASQLPLNQCAYSLLWQISRTIEPRPMTMRPPTRSW